MYRFGYLSVIVPSIGLMFLRPKAELASTRTHSLSLLLCLFILTSAPHLPFAFCRVLSKAPCRSEAFGLALLWGDGTVSGPEYGGPQTLTEGQGLITLVRPHWTCSNDKRIKYLTKLGPFLNLFNGNVM